MGNNGSSGRDQQQSSCVRSCVRSSGLPVSETATHRGWSQSFPRELARHRSQPAAARKVLPEPPNQRLRATDNGCIILNGGTISGRRAATLPSPSPSQSPSPSLSARDLDKQRDVPFRGRSVTMSNVAESRARRADRYRYRYQTDSNRSETSSSDLKRCGSEPDLRYSTDAGLETQDHRSFVHGKANNDREDERSPSYRRLDRETKDRIENRYKARKKYKAPAPPTLLELAVEPASSLDPRRRFERDLEPPPRRSRLFKTRAETKKAQVSWQLSGGLNRSSDRDRGSRDRADVAEQERACERGFERGCERRSSRRGRDDVGDSVDEASIARDWQDHDRIRRRNEHRQRSRLFDGKNTLQRSMSSPEFQAELIQAAKRVRDKLDCSKGVPDESVGDFRSLDSAKPVRERSLEGNPLVGGRAEERRERVSSRARYRNAPRKDEAEARGKIETGEKPNFDRDQARRPLRERLVEDVRTRARIERKHGGGHGRAGELEKYADVGCNALPRFANDDAIETRGWHAARSAGRPITPEKLERRTREKENSDPSCWNDDFKTDRGKRPVVEQWSDTLASRKFEGKFRGSSSGETTTLEDSQPFVASTQSTPKTFYFGMNEILTSGLCNGADQRGEESSRARPRPRRKGEGDGTSASAVDETDDNGRNVIEDISLKLRPTLPKKQLEIPRFSPSAAWRLLSSLEAPGPSMSTTSEEMPVMFEERIERLSRPPPPPPPPPLLAIGPRSLHDKSGDSGISGDAGAANDDSLDVSTTNRMKRSNLATRQTWTPQQDLGEELSSDAGVDSPPPLPASLKYPPRAHVFSLSLPRDDGKTYLYNPDAKLRESSAFNSLKKLKRSVSGAFGIGAHDVQRKRVHDILDDNWLLSTSAPNSLQHNQISSCTWKSFVARDHENGNVDVHSVDDDRDNDRKVHDVAADDCDDDEDDDDDDHDDDDDDDIAEDERLEEDTDGDHEGKEGFPVIMKSPSFSYLAPGGHVMYLPESNEAEYRVQSLNGRKISSASHEDAIVCGRGANETFCRSSADAISSKRRFEDSRSCTDAKTWRGGIDDEFSSFRGLHGGGTRSNAKERGEDPLAVNAEASSDSKHAKSRTDRKTTKRFTFQSTVRQIERRRLAEKLSKEAEAKERQRRGEIEAMRRVEEEFQRKRAKEKASIRQQLRLFKEMEENFNRLPTVEWDGSQLSRADPDGAPSSTTSSPTSLPAGKNVACNEYRRKGDANSRLGSAAVLHSKQRPKYYDWSPEASSHLEYKQTTVHPKIVCDIPKSSPAFVDVNAHPAKPATSSSTPRSDNYRKDFAHGTVGEVAKSSFASSDSELSQPTTRPHSRQIESKGKPQPSRSASPASSEDAATSEEDLAPVDPAKRSENPARNLIFSSVQPFAKEKTYRPISFNPQSPPSVPS